MGDEMRRDPCGTSARRGSPPGSTGSLQGRGEGVFTYLVAGHTLLKTLPSPAAGAEGQCWARLLSCGNEAERGCLGLSLCRESIILRKYQVPRVEGKHGEAHTSTPRPSGGPDLSALSRGTAGKGGFSPAPLHTHQPLCAAGSGP